jgi:hypothetical protein
MRKGTRVKLPESIRHVIQGGVTMKKTVKFLIAVPAGKNIFHGNREYELPAKRADVYVRNGVAVYVDPKDDPTGGKAKPTPRDPSARDWNAAAIPGDTYNWQVKLKLPLLARPYIREDFTEPSEEEPGDPRSGSGPEEVGGYDDGPGPEQERALDYLVENEAAVYANVLRAVADYADEVRSYGGWEAFDPPGVDVVMPQGMTPKQAAERIEITRIAISERSRDGMAYLEIAGECAWDPDHGFEVVLNGDRIVGTYQQGTGWVDRPPRKRSRNQPK